MSFRDRLSDFTKHTHRPDCTSAPLLLFLFLFRFPFTFLFLLRLGKFSLRTAAWIGRHGNFLLCQSDRGSVALAWRLAITMGGGIHNPLRSLPLPTPNPSFSSPPSLPDFSHPLFSPFRRTAQSEEGNRPSFDETSELQHSLLQSTAPSPACLPSLPSNGPLVSPPLAPRPHMPRSSTE